MNRFTTGLPRACRALACMALLLGAGWAQAQGAAMSSRESSVFGNFLIGYATVGDSGSFSETLRTLDASYSQLAADAGSLDSFHGSTPVIAEGGFSTAQDYVFTPTLVSATGATATHVSSPFSYVSLGANGTSTLELEFRVDQPVAFVFSGEVLEQEGPGVGTVASSSLAVVQFTGTGVAGSWNSQATPGAFSTSGLLVPTGRYRLYGSATSRLNGSASYGFNLQLSPVPEPAPWALVLAGSALLVSLHRRRFGR
jgi:hypothetical protein